MVESPKTAQLYTDETYSEPLLNDTEILLTGEMPENAVVRSYPVPYSAESMKTLAAYDITVFYEDVETVFEPEDQSISVTFSMPALLDADPDELAVFHILEDGTEAEVTGISTDGDSVSFDAESFSVYVISEHENSGHPETPRIKFHFLSDEYTENGGGSYTAAPYEFPNRKMELQTSQIVLNSKKLELIKDPPSHEGDSTQNRMYFYGWYAVTPTQVAEDGTVTYTWTDDPLKIDFEKPVTFTADSSCREITWTQGDHTETLTADADGCAHVYLAPLYSEYFFLNFYDKLPESESDQVSLGGHSYHNDSTGAAPYMSSTVSRQAYYEEPLGKFGEEGSEYVDLSDKAPDNYEFGGWYTDQSCTTRFDFDAETMPAGNLAVFAKWVPFEFRVKIDPNGAEIDHIRHTVSDYRTFIFGSDFPEGSEPIPVFRPGSAEKTTQATYFDLSYNETIDEYTLVPRAVYRDQRPQGCRTRRRSGLLLHQHAVRVLDRRRRHSVRPPQRTLCDRGRARRILQFLSRRHCCI